MSFIDAVSTAIVFLFASQNPATAPIPIGTGFIVGYPVKINSDQQTTESVPFIVTAKHVLGGFHKVYARFNTDKGQTQLVEYDLDQIKKNGDFFENVDPGVDIAVFRTQNFLATKFEVIPLDLIASKKDFVTEEIKQTDRVIFPGLLVNFLGNTQNYPIMKDGSIALIPNEKAPISYYVGMEKIDSQQELIFLNTISIPGLSGSPVFLYPVTRLKHDSLSLGGGKFILLGIMHGFYPALPREVQEVKTTNSKFVYGDNSGIAITFPSWRLLEIFESDPLKERVKKLTASEVHLIHEP